MTREEAIKGLKNISTMFTGYKPNEEMFAMAIKALEQEPCEDIAKAFQFGMALGFAEKYDEMDRVIKAVTPKEKTGYWIPVSERLPKDSGKYLVTFGGTYLIGIDFYNNEEDAKEFFEEPDEYIGWNSDNVIAWMPLPEPYKAESEDSAKIDCGKTKCENCTNHNYCDFEPQESERI